MVHVLDRSDAWQRLAELLGAYPPGLPPHFGLEIEAVTANGNSIDMPFEQRVMVQRAFWNCSKVRLVANSDGRSGVGTFHAYAHPHADVVGSHRPYEYFVKIGSRVQISREYLAYRESALEHIPYHLGPRLRLDRCALGPHQGIIVSDYVSGAEKLRDCARDGRAVPVIASLFNTTLRNWRDASTKVDRSLQDYLSDRMPCEIPTHRKLRVRELGGTKTPAELSKLWLARASRPVQVGFVHGDLHALNVMVRNGDAIVIDFEKVKGSAPLLLDLASLEGGLFVDGFVGDLRDGQSLMRSIEQLYQVETLLDGRFEQCHPSDGSAWFFDCVSQIRLQARQIELDRGQYALTLATELTKKACKEVDFNKENGSSAGALTGEDVRALAYVIAERILIEISSDPVKLIER